MPEATTPADTALRASLRAAMPGDERFFRELYRETRKAEFAGLAWGTGEVQALCDAQFDMHARAHRSAFPEAEHFVVELDGAAAGRMIVGRAAEGLWLLELALMPAIRGQGVGSRLLRGLQERARAASVPLHVHVEASSRALGWYRRLGFTDLGQEGLHVVLAWTPP